MLEPRFSIRLPKELVEAIEAWRQTHNASRLTYQQVGRAEAIRKLVEAGLAHDKFVDAGLAHEKVGIQTRMAVDAKGRLVSASKRLKPTPKRGRR